jgi:hypothetical protein
MQALDSVRRLASAKMNAKTKKNNNKVNLSAEAAIYI